MPASRSLELVLVPAERPRGRGAGDAAGVDHVVGRVEDARARAAARRPRARRAGCSRSRRRSRQREARDRLGVERAADGARRVDVALGRRARASGGDRLAAGRGRAATSSTSADEHARARVGELAREVARRPRRRPGRARVRPGEVGRAEDVLDVARIAVQHAARGAAAAVAAAAGRPVDPRAASRRRRRGRPARCSCRRPCW